MHRLRFEKFLRLSRTLSSGCASTAGSSDRFRVDQSRTICLHPQGVTGFEQMAGYCCIAAEAIATDKTDNIHARRGL